MQWLGLILVYAFSTAMLAAQTPQQEQQQAPTETASSPYQSLSAATAKVAETYIQAYLSKDWDALESYLADDCQFADPTATAVFGKVSVKGKTAVLEYFRQNYAAIKHMQLQRSRVLVSGQHAIYEGVLNWTLAQADGSELQIKAMPFLSILEIVNGQLISHQDYADYQPYLDAYQANTQASTEASGSDASGSQQR